MAFPFPLVALCDDSEIVCDDGGGDYIILDSMDGSVMMDDTTAAGLIITDHYDIVMGMELEVASQAGAGGCRVPGAAVPKSSPLWVLFLPSSSLSLSPLSQISNGLDSRGGWEGGSDWE